MWVSDETDWFISISLHWAGIAQLVIQLIVRWERKSMGKKAVLFLLRNWTPLMFLLRGRGVNGQGINNRLWNLSLSECSTFQHLSHRAGRTSVGKGVRLLLGKCRWIPKRRKEGKDSCAFYGVTGQLWHNWKYFQWADSRKRYFQKKQVLRHRSVHGRR